MGTLNDKVGELNSGVGSLTDGAGVLSSGLTNITENGQLTDAAYTAYEGLCTAASTALNNQLQANGFELCHTYFVWLFRCIYSFAQEDRY